MINQVAKEACIDMDAIYATGVSNGGMFVHRLASELQAELAGVVPVYGKYLIETCSILFHRSCLMRRRGNRRTLIPSFYAHFADCIMHNAMCVYYIYSFDAP